MSVSSIEVERSVENALAHYGVRGMHWGVRKADSGSPRSPSPVVARTKTGTSKIETAGGKNHPASDDALKVAAARQKLHGSGMNSLSNAELKAITDRMNMERSFKEAVSKLPPKHPARHAVKKMLKEQGKSELQQIVKGGQGPWVKRIGLLLTVAPAARKAPRGAATAAAGALAIRGIFKNTGGKHKK